jgi:hypothetical protein
MSGSFDPASPVIWLTLAGILAGSVWMFVMLIRRETIHRRQVALREWAANRGLKWIGPNRSSESISALIPLPAIKPKFDFLLSGKGITLAQVHTEDSPVNALTTPRWNILVRRMDHPWPATALRPTARPVSVVDLFSLSSFPSLASNQRFMIFGTESQAAQILAESTAPALLPADIGLVLSGQDLILDFTARPFDETEFARMIDLADQLVPRL